VKIALASDHAGFDYKQQIADHLRNDGYGVVDFGCHSSESCDYPDFVHPAAAAVAAGECDRGIVFGGSGNGEAITANRHAGIRCALCWNEETARLSRLHNDANMISLGQRMLDQSTAIKAVDIWLSTEFEGGRQIARIRGIDKLPPC
jgi:ribose 5-phosphate isomerase B